ncbi:hypothetical protein FHU30_002329 [Actinomadura rupiterrae]|nr:hypothetical protein [Actinomadura rupiterrae]
MVPVALAGAVLVGSSGGRPEAAPTVAATPESNPTVGGYVPPQPKPATQSPVPERTVRPKATTKPQPPPAKRTRRPPGQERPGCPPGWQDFPFLRHWCDRHGR